MGIGGSVVGTGLNTRPAYAGMMIDELENATSLPLRPAGDKREAMQSRRAEAGISAALRNLALELGRIANDLRLMASGPRSGLREILLPEVAPGSSVVPGKVNPSMLEMLNMVCFQVMGNDTAVAVAAGAGQLELNVMMPVIAWNLHFALRILTNALRETRVRCIEGIKADDERCRRYAESSLGLAVALVPALGYEKAAEVARKALENDQALIDVVRAEKLIPEDRLAEIFDLETLTEPCVPGLMKK
jgi:aspartate ammonia-lyase